MTHSQRTRIFSALTMTLLALSGCAETDPTSPTEADTSQPIGQSPPTRSQRLACDAVLKGEGLSQGGQATVRYELDRARQTYTLTLVGEGGKTLAKGTSTQWDVSEETSAALITLEDPAGLTQYAATAHTSFVPGYGFETYSVRKVGQQVLYGRTLLTANPARDHYQLGAATLAAEADASWQGQPVVTLSYVDPEAEGPVAQEALDAWLEQQGLGDAATGQWAQWAEQMFLAQAPWRKVAAEHLLFCEYGEDAQLRGVTISEPALKPSALVNAVVDPDCYEEQLKKKREATGARLAKVKKVVDAVALGQKLLGGNAVDPATKALDKAGAGIELDLGGGFVFKVNGDVMTNVVTNLTPLATRRLALAAAGPLGIAILGAGVAVDVAIIVNDAFGEEIHRSLDKALGRGPKPPVGKPAEDLGTIEGWDTDSTPFSSPSAGSRTDPHLRTHDGLAYGFHATGDFLLTQDTKGGFEIHTRQQPGSSVCQGVAVNTRVAVRLGAQRLEYDGEWSLDGQPLVVYKEGVTLEGGRLSKVGNKFLLTTALGDLIVFKGSSVISVNVGISKTRAGRMRGLLGDADGVATQEDDLALSDGRRVSGDTVPWTELNGAFAQSWRLTPETSLFTYAQGEGPDDFIVPGYPSRPTRLENYEPSAVAMATQVCLDAGVSGTDVLDECSLDALCMDSTLLAEALDAHVGQEEPRTRALVEYPLFLDGWTQEGEPASGEWEVAPDGLSVVQKVNGEPTFLISPQDYDDHTIMGSWEAKSGDDDFIGFVFGYNGPFAKEGDGFNQFDTLLLGWKRREQSRGLEGLVLSYVDALVDDYYDYFWSYSKAKVIAQDTGPGKGWQADRIYNFILSYSAEQLRVFIDGRPIFSLPAARAPGGRWPKGRFGFYNYSQPTVRYADFVALEGTSNVIFYDNFDDEPESETVSSLPKWAVLGDTQIKTSRVYGKALRTSGVSTLDPITLPPGRYRLSMEVWAEGQSGDASTIEFGPLEPIVLEHTKDPSWRNISRTFEVTKATQSPIKIVSNNPQNPLWVDKVILLKFD